MTMTKRIIIPCLTSYAGIQVVLTSSTPGDDHDDEEMGLHLAQIGYCFVLCGVYDILKSNIQNFNIERDYRIYLAKKGREGLAAAQVSEIDKQIQEAAETSGLTVGQIKEQLA